MTPGTGTMPRHCHVVPADSCSCLFGAAALKKANLCLSHRSGRVRSVAPKHQ
jgi:hypothetical protein